MIILPARFRRPGDYEDSEGFLGVQMFQFVFSWHKLPLGHEFLQLSLFFVGQVPGKAPF